MGALQSFFTGGMPLKEIKTRREDRKPRLMDEAAKVPKTAMKDLWLKSKEKSVTVKRNALCKSARGVL